VLYAVLNLPSCVRVIRHALRLKRALCSLIALGFLTLSGCGGVRHPSLVSSSPEWERSSDQEVIELLRQGEGALWGVAQGQLLAWNLTSERLHRASTPLPSSVQVNDLWVERLEVSRLNRARARYYESYLKKMKEVKPQRGPAQAPAQESIIDLDGIEIEEEGLEIEIEGEGSEGSLAQGTEEVVELDLSDVVIDTTTSPAPTAQPKRALPPPPVEVASRFRVYLATSGGIYRREVWLDAQWRDLLGDQAWRRLYQGEVRQLSPRSSGGAWWAGERGFGWLKKGKIAGRLERMSATQISMKRGGGAWVLLHDPAFQTPQLISVAERIWQDGGEPLGVDERPAVELLSQLDPERLKRGAVCPSSPLQLVSAQAVTSKGEVADKGQVRSFALCAPTVEGGAPTLSVEDKGQWRSMTIRGSEGEGALQLAPWGGTALLKGERGWWVVREGLRAHSTSSGSPTDQRLSLQRSTQETAGGPQLRLDPLSFDELLPYTSGAWATGSDQDGRPWLSWSRQHQGVVSRIGDQGGLRKRFETESFAAYHETRPYSLDHEGTLWVPQLQGASTFSLGGGGWRYMKAPEGRTLGVAHCGAQTLFMVSKRALKPKPKLTLELWTPGAEVPLAQIDWNDALFRVGEPKLGDVACDQEGAIYGALFWGQGWSGSGVGVLHIPADRMRAEVWGARQGFDGEEELTETPLLPDFTVNAVAVAPDRRVFLATNSGLAVVGAPTQAKGSKRSMTLLSESSGWVTDFINDVSVGADGRAWVATDKGLFVLNQELKARLTTLKLRMSAVAVEPNTGLVWVALHDKLYRGDGQVETWERVSVEGSFPLGTIKRVLSFDEGGARGAQGRAQVWLATTRGLLRTSVGQR